MCVSLRLSACIFSGEESLEKAQLDYYYYYYYY
jgi:hypothetical protein